MVQAHNLIMQILSLIRLFQKVFFKTTPISPQDIIFYIFSYLNKHQGYQKLEEAKSLAAFGTTIFPNDFASWSALFELSPDGSNEKLAYKKRLHKIDPYNPKYFD